MSIHTNTEVQDQQEFDQQLKELTEEKEWLQREFEEETQRSKTLMHDLDTINAEKKGLEDTMQKMEQDRQREVEEVRIQMDEWAQQK